VVQDDQTCPRIKEVILSLFRRHKRKCKAGHARQRQTSEFEERKKDGSGAIAPIVASGTLNKIPNRKSTGQWEWEPARKIADSWDASGNWEGLVTTPPELAPPPPKGKLITEAIKEFLDDFNDTAARNTTKKYRILLGKLQAFSDDLGYVLINQWTTPDVRAMRKSWKISTGQSHSEHGVFQDVL
jgi:hypothetical protein